jgi:L-cysteate sulfo-lyase
LTTGGLQSNHARLTAAACARLGLACELFLSRAVPRSDDNYERNGNVLLDDLFGAQIHIVPRGETPLAVAETRAEELRASGRRVLVIPTGGSTPLGCLGYASCALEIFHQEAQFDKPFRQIIVPNGSSGTHAGLAAGFAMLGRGARSVRSYSVLADLQSTLHVTSKLTQGTLQLLGHDTLPTLDEMDIDGSHRGEGYGIPTGEMVDAVRLMAAREGLLIDPVYSGKAFAGLLADIRQGRYSAGDNLLFVMTGGAPGLYAYRDAFGQF